MMGITKKENQDSIGITENTLGFRRDYEKWSKKLLGFYRDSEKNHDGITNGFQKKLLGFHRDYRKFV